jgi:hypothetical protein
MMEQRGFRNKANNFYFWYEGHILDHEKDYWGSLWPKFVMEYDDDDDDDILKCRETTFENWAMNTPLYNIVLMPVFCKI